MILMKTDSFIVTQDNGPDLYFEGVLLAEVSNRPADSELNTHTSQWLELSLYRTAGGKFVCERGRCTAQPREPDRYEAAICDDEAAVFAFFGYGRLSKELYDLAAINALQQVS